jgi:hypothetical protein
MLAASGTNLPMVKLLVENGAHTNDGGIAQRTALARAGLRLQHSRDSMPVVEWLLLQGGVDASDIWELLRNQRGLDNSRTVGIRELVHVVATKLLRIAVLMTPLPADMVAHFSPYHASIVGDGRYLRQGLSAYVDERQAFLDTFPQLVAVPTVLLAVVYSFEGPITAEECVSIGLGGTFIEHQRSFTHEGIMITITEALAEGTIAQRLPPAADPANMRDDAYLWRGPPRYAQIPLIYGPMNLHAPSRAARDRENSLRATHSRASTTLTAKFLKFPFNFINTLLHNRRRGKRAESLLDVFHRIRTLYVFILQRTCSHVLLSFESLFPVH